MPAPTTCSRCPSPPPEPAVYAWDTGAARFMPWSFADSLAGSEDGTDGGEDIYDVAISIYKLQLESCGRIYHF